MAQDGGADWHGRDKFPSEYQQQLDRHISELPPSVRDGLQATMSLWQGKDFGMNILTQEAFRDTPDVFDIHLIFDRLRNAGQLNTWESPSRFYEIGSPEGLAEVREMLK